jgi:transcriptional regulator with XRE-family HTH domain
MKNEEILLNLANKLKGLRKIKTVTQEQVLHDTGVHIARIEQGKRDISYTTLVKLANYFGVGLEAFK